MRLDERSTSQNVMPSIPFEFNRKIASESLKIKAYLIRHPIICLLEKNIAEIRSQNRGNPIKEI